MAKIPSAVRKQGEESERLIAEQKKLLDPQDTDPGTPAQPASNAELKQKEPNDNIAPAANPQNPTETDEYKNLDHRFRQYKASTDNTLHELRQLVQTLQSQSQGNEQLDALNQQIKTLEEQLKQAREQQHQPSGYDVLDSDEQKEYDPDFANVVSKISKAEAEKATSGALENAMAQIGSLTKRLDTIDNGVTEIQNNSIVKNEASFFKELDQLVPAWETIQATPGFNEFTRELNEATGWINQQLIEKAFNDLDAKRMAIFYNKFADANNVSVETGQVKSGLEKMIEPDSSGGGTQPLDPADKRIIKVAEVNEFYRKASIGKIPKDEMQRREQEYILAQQENRIVE